MTALHLDLSTELGPDHHFHVVPSVSEYLFLIAKGGLRACRGPAESMSLGCGCSRVFPRRRSWSPGPSASFSGIPPSVFAPLSLLTPCSPPARCLVPLVTANIF